MESFHVLESISPNSNPTCTGKRRLSESDADNNVTLTNKFIVLENGINNNVDIQNVNASSQQKNNTELRNKITLNLVK